MFSVLLQLLLAMPLTLGQAIQKPVAAQDTRQYTVYNKCPTPIDLYIAGVKDSTIPKGGYLVKFLGTGAGFFYTDANGGGPARGSVRAAFYEDFYYMVVSPNPINAGLQVEPKGHAASNGFCETIQCNNRGCPQAFSQPPTRFPGRAPTAPTPPFYRCPYPDVPFDITFCPTGGFPNPNQGQPIHFFFQNKCLDVKGGVLANGTPVQIYDCNGSPAQQWFIKIGSTKIKLAGTDFCLDAGTSPANGVQLKIWQCYDNLPSQQWSYTNDHRIALENQGFCVDLENGITTNGNKVQIWKCADNDSNQIWTL
jgi:hypothetical protein